MSNMSYCRFRSTLLDLRDCLSALENGDELSKPEYESCVAMFNLFVGFLIDNGIVDEDNELEERLQDFFESINREDKTNEN